MKMTMTLTTYKLRLGTRGSLLARMQSQLVADELQQAHPGLQVELLIIKTTGDSITDRPLHDIGGKGLFTKELERALLDGQIDFAVHSFKDVPVTMPLIDISGLVIACTPRREDARDTLAVRLPTCEKTGPRPTSLSTLPIGIRVGTGSSRRRCQILRQRPDLIVEPIRGNIDTRLRKLAEGQYEAVVLATAGLRRANLFNATYMTPLEPTEILSAPGQGALALQCRAQDAQTRHLLQSLHDSDTAVCVETERELVNRLDGDCHSPIAALAEIRGETLHFKAVVGRRDGGLPVVSAQASGFRANASAVVDSIFSALSEAGVQALLRPIR